MNNLDVRIVELEPMKVICFNGFGENPETQALQKLLSWAKENGHLPVVEGQRFFGYNNPDPAAGSPNYGYDVWMTIGEDVVVEGEARRIDFKGGLYAVLRCPVTKPWEDIPAAWKKLVGWLDDSPYKNGSHQWLEEHFNLDQPSADGSFTLDLFLPIRK